MHQITVSSGPYLTFTAISEMGSKIPILQNEKLKLSSTSLLPGTQVLCGRARGDVLEIAIIIVIANICCVCNVAGTTKLLKMLSNVIIFLWTLCDSH